jgi:hypothetical protein
MKAHVLKRKVNMSQSNHKLREREIMLKEYNKVYHHVPCT